LFAAAAAAAASLALEDLERANSFFTFSMIDAMLDDIFTPVFTDKGDSQSLYGW
jgi:hypothetical protein